MTQISRYKIDKKVYDDIFDNFLQVVSGIDSKEKATLFMDNFLTKTEKIMLSKRLAIGVLVSQGINYRDISSILKVSTGTVGVFASHYKYNDKYKKIIDGVVKNKKMYNLLIKIAGGVTKAIGFGGKGSRVWKELNRNILDKESSLYQ